VGRIAHEAGRVLQSITTVDELLRRFSDIVKDGLGTDRVVILFAENGCFRQVFPPSEESPPLVF